MAASRREEGIAPTVMEIPRADAAAALDARIEPESAAPRSLRAPGAPVRAARAAGQVRAMTPAAPVASTAFLLRLANAEADCRRAQAFREAGGPPAAAA